MSDNEPDDQASGKHLFVYYYRTPAEKVRGPFEGGFSKGGDSSQESGFSQGDWSFSINSDGGTGGGLSGGFGGSSRKKARRRAKARAQAVARMRAAAEAQARAQEAAHQQARHEQAQAAHRQLINELFQAHASQRVELDRVYQQARADLPERLKAEVQAARKAPGNPGDERWQLYLITKQKSEIAGLMASKQSALPALNSKLLAFDGRNPLLNGGEDYPRQLHERSQGNGHVARELHQGWVETYRAAHEHALLSESIRLLSEQLRDLSAHYDQEVIKWRKIDELHEGYRQYEEQRGRHVSHHLRVEEDQRKAGLHSAHTRHIPVDMAARGAIFMGRSDAELTRDLARALEAQVGAAAREVIRIAGLRAGQTLAVSINALLYAPVLGNGELTPEQRRRLFEGVGVKAGTMGLPVGTDLHALAEAGGSVELPTRIKPVPSEQGTELHVVATGAGMAASVPVIKAVPDASGLTHQATLAGVPERHLSFDNLPATARVPTAGNALEHRLFSGPLQPIELPAGLDSRFDDCILCFAPESGLEPLYVSFALKAPGHGIVSGHGQPGTAEWRKSFDAAQGATIPEQAGERLRWREFNSLEAFDRSLWRTLGEDPTLSAGFDPLNNRRMLQGLAPYAPKAHWVGERRHYEIRAADGALDQRRPYSLDNLRITRPDSDQSVVRFVPLAQPWPTAGANHTWTPLRAPGAELLGTPGLPLAPDVVTVYPGGDSEPVPGLVSPLPGVDPADVQAAIPGYAEDDDLPESGLVFAEPVKLLETGPYNKLERRSRRDGMDVDHIISRAAYIKLVRIRYPEITIRQARKMSDGAPSIVIPHEVHRDYSETYTSKNTPEKQDKDAGDPEVGVNSNFDAIKIGLLKMGLDEGLLEKAREELHQRFRDEGFY